MTEIGRSVIGREYRHHRSAGAPLPAAIARLHLVDSRRSRLAPARPRTSQSFESEDLKALVHPLGSLIDVKDYNSNCLSKSGLVGQTYSQM